MYIEKIEIKKFRVLENMEGDNALYFQPPGGATADPKTGNVINVIAGVNGSGKTTLLDLICDVYAEYNGHHKVGLLLDYQDEVASEFFENEDKLVSTFLKNKLHWKYPIVDHINDALSGRITRLYNVVYFSFEDFKRKSNNRDPRSIEKKYQKLEETIYKYVLALERESYEAIPEKRSKDAILKFNEIFEGVDFYTSLSGIVYGNGTFKPEFVNVNGERVFIEDLSDGEQRLYLSAIKMMENNYHDSIILMDEPEVSLHPAWQQKIMSVYSRIGKNNQFIVATHSPQIIASVPYKNRIVLRKENGKIQSFHMSQPPSGVDVNSILSEIMGADPRPPELLKLYAQYRKFVEERKENTEEALKVKAQLSEESEHSQFMQEMSFLIELRDA